MNPILDEDFDLYPMPSREDLELLRYDALQAWLDEEMNQ